MKSKLAVLVGALSVGCLSAPAQLFTSESLGGAAVGGLIGGIVGHNSGGHTAEGMGIGAGAGWLLGTVLHQARADEGDYSPPPAYAVPGPAYGYYYPAYRPNYALTGAALGGLAGGIIGHNSHERTLEGIGIGAGTGLLLGGLAEARARRYESAAAPIGSPPSVVSNGRLTYSAAASPMTPGAASAPVPSYGPSSVPPSNPVSAGSPMSGANRLFGR